MEFTFSCKGSAIPCEVVVDDDNGRYMLRKADHTGEFFNNTEQLLEWVQANWNTEDFTDPDDYEKLVSEIKKAKQV